MCLQQVASHRHAVRATHHDVRMQRSLPSGLRATSPISDTTSTCCVTGIFLYSFFCQSRTGVSGR